VKNVLKFKSNAFSHTQNTPRMSREGNQMVFSNEEKPQFPAIFQQTKENLENIGPTKLN